MTAPNLDSLGLTHRNGEEADEPFVYATMLRSFWDSPRNVYLSGPTFFKEHHQIIESILACDTTALTIACLHDDPAVIIGYLLFDPVQEIIHYMYVKGPFQGNGVARRLIAANACNSYKWRVTHMTEDGEKFWKHHKWVFNPYLLVK